MEELENLLHSGEYSCVIRNVGITRFFSGRGVADLLSLLRNEPDFLDGAQIADKVIGKAAAALMIEGKVREIYSDLVSSPALELLEKHGISVTFDEEVPVIINRKKDGICPLEALSKDLTSTSEIVVKIKEFLTNKNK